MVTINDLHVVGMMSYCAKLTGEDLLRCSCYKFRPYTSVMLSTALHVCETRKSTALIHNTLDRCAIMSFTSDVSGKY